MAAVAAALNPIAFQLGAIQVHWYGIIIASGVVLALVLAVREGQRLGIPEDDFYDYLLWAIPAGNWPVGQLYEPGSLWRGY